MNFRRRVEKLEEELAKQNSSRWAPNPGPVTEEEVWRELAANVLWCWRERCRARPIPEDTDGRRGASRLEPDPDNRHTWGRWRPGRAPRDYPERADLYLEEVDAEVSWMRRKAPLPDDVSTVDPQWYACDVWSGWSLCPVWEWVVFEQLREEMPQDWWESVEPKPRPYPIRHAEGEPDWSALARWCRGERVPEPDE